MKVIHTRNTVKIPEDVELILNRRHVTVKGKRGTLERNFKHAQLELVYEEIKEEGKPTKKQLRVDSWFANKKQLAQIRTVCSSIENMIKGVKYGYRYAMKSVYAHFPINLTFEGGGNKSVQVRNFLGEKVVRNVAMLDGVTVRASGEKDEIFVEGNNLEKVSQSAALIHQSALVTTKDIRKFLDGVYVSDRTTVTPVKD